VPELTAGDIGRGHCSEPLVSIGLPVYNGEQYLESAIDSILAQTFRDFELIICDNASTDGTAVICKDAAARDDRIRYFRNETNIGGARNGNLTATHARGQYFRLAGYDDLLAPDLLERSVAVLEHRPDVVVCHPAFLVIDGEGNEQERLTRNRPPMNPARLFASLTGLGYGCEETYGLMRRESLLATGLYRDYTDSDRSLLANMALMGQFYEIPEPLFFRRIHPHSSTQIYTDWRARMRWFGEEYADRVSFPHWAQLGHYLVMIARSPADPWTKLKCYGFMPVWIGRHHRWGALGKDLILGLVQLARRPSARRGGRHVRIPASSTTALVPRRSVRPRRAWSPYLGSAERK
jgi:glycosyltransferase involved in cell wall biosynthesis